MYEKILSEEDINIIRKDPDKVNWGNISYNENLSEEFIAENLSKLNLNKLLENKATSEETKTHIRMFI